MLYIRRPTLHDLNDCAQLDASFTTQRVWQLNLGVEPNDIQVNLHLVRLPRPINVKPMSNGENLMKPWQRGDCMFTARHDNTIAGFIHVVLESGSRVGYIQRHIVAPDFRNQGIGGKLLDYALQWSRDHRLGSVIAQVSTKNHPAVAFYLDRGFSFCGFNERFYADQEITLDLARTIR